MAVLAALPAVSGFGLAVSGTLPFGSLVSSFASGKRLGLEYIARFPEEADLTFLERKITADIDVPDVQSGNLATIRRMLTARIRADFEQGNVVTLEGWMLARTELRMCAIAALV
jgi:hypothetical protein